MSPAAVSIPLGPIIRISVSGKYMVYMIGLLLSVWCCLIADLSMPSCGNSFLNCRIWQEFKFSH